MWKKQIEDLSQRQIIKEQPHGNLHMMPDNIKDWVKYLVKFIINTSNWIIGFPKYWNWFSKLEDGTEIRWLFSNWQLTTGKIKYSNDFISQVDINYSQLKREKVVRKYDVMIVWDLHWKKIAYNENLKTLWVIDNNWNWIWWNKTVVFLWDILADRWTDGLEIMIEINKLRKDARMVWWDIKVIAGNHEDFFIDFLIWIKTNKGDPFWLLNAKHKNQWLWLLELKRYWSQELRNTSYEDPQIWEKLWKERKNILLNMRNDQEWKIILDEICNMELVTRIDDSLFLHTNPTNKLLCQLKVKNFDFFQMNYIFRKWLEDILLKWKRLEDIPRWYLLSFRESKKIFLHTWNRINFANNTLEHDLVQNWINNIFHWHTHSDGLILDMEENIKIVNVDKSAFKDCDNVSMNKARSVSMINRKWNILLWEDDF